MRCSWFLIFLLFSEFLIGCKTTRPVIDISEPGYNPELDSRNSQSAQIKPTKAAETEVGSIPASVPWTIFGYGLSLSVLDRLSTSPSDKTFQDFDDGIFLSDCLPITDKEWRSSALVLSGGRLYGADIFFSNEQCSGKPLRELKDHLSLYVGDWERVLSQKKIQVSWTKDQVVLAFPNAQNLKLNRLGAKKLESQSESASASEMQTGFGLSPLVKMEKKGINPLDRLLNFDEERTFVSSCLPRGDGSFYLSGVKLVKGFFYGLNYVFSDELCAEKIISKAMDSEAFSVVEYMVFLKKHKKSFAINNERILIGNAMSQTFVYESWPKKSTRFSDVISGVGTLYHERFNANSSKPLKFSLSGSYVGDCVAFTPSLWKASGYEIHEGDLVGADYYYENESCSGLPWLSFRDEYKMDFSTWANHLKQRSIAAEMQSETLVLTYSSGAEVVFFKLP